MKGTSYVTCFLLAYLCIFAHADQPAVADAKPRNGVFFTYTGYMTTVLELNDGHFRYWFESDAKLPKEQKYPLTGEYSMTGSTITLHHDKVSQPQWTFRVMDDRLTLWRPDAIVSYGKDHQLDTALLRSFGSGSILVLTDKTAEDVWKHRGPPIL